VKGRWLEQGKTLGYYHFKNGVSVEGWVTKVVLHFVVGLIRVS